MKGALPLITYATLITHLATILPDIDATAMTAMVAALPIDPHTPYHDGSSEPTHTDILGFLDHLGMAAEKSNHEHEAHSFYTILLQIHDQSHTRDDALIISVLIRLGKILERQPPRNQTVDHRLRIYPSNAWQLCHRPSVIYPCTHAL